ncbi:unnamed protein product [Paramecium pentaurelia]|uniref:AD domain-containing protein n=1 Tax=Paramecium pentaurelia TaxID=43138 RepID=A0A8S1TDM6_9CILI|nr:unnamed protein product [Paramecium pentaurelia]
MSKQQWTLLTTDTQKLQLFGMQAKVTTNYENDDDFFLINQQSIQELQTIDIQDPKQTLQNLLAIDLAAMAQEMLKKEMKEPHQQLFDHLQKLYRDVDWKDQEIIIPSISIRISPPYKSDNITGENKLGVDRLRKIVMYIIMNFLCRLINMPKIFEYSQTLYIYINIIIQNCNFVFFNSMNNREEEKTHQIDDTENNNDEKLRQQYLQDLQRRVKKSRKQPDCFECCFAYWLFVFLGFMFTQVFLKKIYETPEGCNFIRSIILLQLIQFSLSACCRCIDGCCILIPCKNTRWFHLSLSFHDLNNRINYKTCKWALIILTVTWLLNQSCIVFWPMFIFLLIIWIIILVWKQMKDE